MTARTATVATRPEPRDPDPRDRGHTFSAQTFSTTYRPERHVDRIGRHAPLILRQARAESHDGYAFTLSERRKGG